MSDCGFVDLEQHIQKGRAQPVGYFNLTLLRKALENTKGGGKVIEVMRVEHSDGWCLAFKNHAVPGDWFCVAPIVEGEIKRHPREFKDEELEDEIKCMVSDTGRDYIYSDTVFRNAEKQPGLYPIVCGIMKKYQKPQGVITNALKRRGWTRAGTSGAHAQWVMPE